jgi:hypothetical protein
MRIIAMKWSRMMIVLPFIEPTRQQKVCWQLADSSQCRQTPRSIWVKCASDEFSFFYSEPSIIEEGNNNYEIISKIRLNILPSNGGFSLCAIP